MKPDLQYATISVPNLPVVAGSGDRLSRWKGRMFVPLLASFLLHALLLFYFGWYELSSRPSGEGVTHVPLSVVLRPPPPAPEALEAPPKTEAPVLAPSHSLRHKPGSSRKSPAEAADARFHAREKDQNSPIDLEAAYAIARQQARSSPKADGSRVDQEPSALERETPLGHSIARSARPDCRSEHAGAGLLAIPVMLADALTDSGCKW